MDPRRLRLLVELSRLGSMREVADSLDLTTSTVSQQIAALARDCGVALLEPDGRRVRLTPAGRRLADHAVTILAAVDAARLDLDPEAEPAGTVRVGGFATAIRSSLLPVVVDLARSHPRVEVSLREYEPLEAVGLLLDDELDLALTYDYDLAPAAVAAELEAVPLWTAAWGLGVQAGGPAAAGGIAAYRRHAFIVNSRNTADEDVVRTLAALAGFTPRIAHRIDSLDLVEDLIGAGHGVGLLPLTRPTGALVEVVELTRPTVTMTAYAVTRRGRAAWPPLRLLRDALLSEARPVPRRRPWPRPAAGRG